MKKIIFFFVILWAQNAQSQCDSTGKVTHDTIIGYVQYCNFSHFGIKFGCHNVPVIGSTTHDTLFTVTCVIPKLVDYGLFHYTTAGILSQIQQAQYVGAKTLRYNYVWGNTNQTAFIKSYGLKVHLFYNDNSVTSNSPYQKDTVLERTRLISLYLNLFLIMEVYIMNLQIHLIQTQTV